MSFSSTPLPWAACSRAWKASFLLASTPMMQREALRILCKMATPCNTPWARSSITRWSALRYGSHSAPLSSRKSIFLSLGGESLTWAGKVAPPMPTMPPSNTRESRASRSSRAGSMGAMEGSHRS